MYRFQITGVVQGVGFRPHIHREARKRGISGYVYNGDQGAIIVADNREAIEDIIRDLPDRMRVDTVAVAETDEVCEGFSIRESTGSGFAEIPADYYLCPDCLSELRDPENRRHGYFFTTCTECGPRFTIARKSPYDREHTAMADFEMCEACRREYEDPENRRYHAQTIACHDCGPKLSLYHGEELIVSGTDAEVVREAIERIRDGEIVAVKGIGGFHLVCRTAPETVRELKRLTGRTEKPFALLCRDLDMVEGIASIDEEERKLLESVARPIVIVRKNVELAEVSELDSVGIMLPSSALHYLLFDHIDEPLVMTSSNRAGQPISRERAEQFTPYVLDCDRGIVNPADDSLAKVIAGRTFLVRRSRGYVPESLSLPEGTNPPILACGAERHHTFALSDGSGIMTSQYFGNTGNADVFTRFTESVDRMLDMTGIEPKIIATDLHPEFNTSRFGERLARERGVRHMAVQHHRAHAYSIALEHGIEDFTAIICDGLGYGDDGTLWGGEVFRQSERVGHLEPQFQLGGDSATRYPSKMAYSILRKFLPADEAARVLGDVFGEKEYETLDTQWTSRLNASETTSCGRVLDAAAALLGFCREGSYDGRPAMLLESAATDPYTLDPIIEDGVLLTTPLFEYLVRNRSKDPARLAATVENYLVRGLYEIARQYDTPLLFGGGCAYNRRMSSYLIEKGAYTNTKLPAGDGGISAGQIAYVLSIENEYI